MCVLRGDGEGRVDWGEGSEGQGLGCLGAPQQRAAPAQRVRARRKPSSADRRSPRRPATHMCSEAARGSARRVLRAISAAVGLRGSRPCRKRSCERGPAFLSLSSCAHPAAAGRLLRGVGEVDPEAQALSELDVYRVYGRTPCPRVAGPLGRGGGNLHGGRCRMYVVWEGLYQIVAICGLLALRARINRRMASRAAPQQPQQLGGGAARWQRVSGASVSFFGLAGRPRACATRSIDRWRSDRRRSMQWW